MLFQLNENCEFLWRICKAVYLNANIAGINGDRDKKESMINDAIELGAKAVRTNSNSSEAHKWYAIVVGSRGEFLGIKDKILDGFEFKRHVDIAAELSPQDHTIQHLLGRYETDIIPHLQIARILFCQFFLDRFCFEVAELSWWERKMASTLFAEPPVATMEEANEHFRRAESIKPEGWKENRLFLSKTFIKMQEYKEAAKWLKKAAELPVANADDKEAHDDVLNLLEEYEHYADPTENDNVIVAD